MFVPYLMKTVKMSINDEVTWYSNKFKNTLLKIKRFFVNPKYLRNSAWYPKKPIDPRLYCKITVGEPSRQGE